MSTTNTWYQQSLVSIADLSKDDINIFLKQAHVLKQKRRLMPLVIRLLVIVFLKPQREPGSLLKQLLIVWEQRLSVFQILRKPHTSKRVKAYQIRLK